MTSGFRVICSDGVSRHGDLFPTKRDALTWQTFRHICPFGHFAPRREAAFNLPPAPTSLESARSGPGAGGPIVGTGVLVPSQSPNAPGDDPSPVPTPSSPPPHPLTTQPLKEDPVTPELGDIWAAAEGEAIEVAR